MLKVCNTCKIELPLDSFHKRKDSVCGVRSDCKKCHRQKGKVYQNNNNELLRKKGRLYRQKNQVQTLLWIARNRAKKKGLDYSLTFDDIKIPEFCPVFGYKLESQLDKAAHNSPSIDRIDSSKGYTKENTQVISLRANVLKNNATLEEIEKLYFWLLSEKNK